MAAGRHRMRARAGRTKAFHVHISSPITVGRPAGRSAGDCLSRALDITVTAAGGRRLVNETHLVVNGEAGHRRPVVNTSQRRAAHCRPAGGDRAMAARRSRRRSAGRHTLTTARPTQRKIGDFFRVICVFYFGVIFR